ncbi:hypothetical protein BJ508DRAFT_410486 [Ascobolus immersus RN42]|uniref:Uncharacterized protein n=1 Tax=Ascobolus immersus RN42 TaxID=1160509 RepID=A0A3N4IUA7_ASCIM|nr:hypothetical protein BJ508DRAFT_410486 [Ascobolus immersus RN42]
MKSPSCSPWSSSITIFFVIFTTLLPQIACASLRTHRRDSNEFFTTPNASSIIFFGEPTLIAWRNDGFIPLGLRGLPVLVELVSGGGLPIYEVSRHRQGDLNDISWTPPNSPELNRNTVYDAILRYIVGGGDDGNNFSEKRQWVGESEKFKFTDKLNEEKAKSEIQADRNGAGSNTIGPQASTTSTGGTTTVTVYPPEEPEEVDTHWIATAAVGGSLGGICLILAAILVFVLVRLLPKASTSQGSRKRDNSAELEGNHVPQMEYRR